MDRYTQDSGDPNPTTDEITAAGIKLLLEETRRMRFDLQNYQQHHEEVAEKFNRHFSGMRQTLGCLAWALVVIPLLVWLFVGCGAMAGIGGAL